MKRTGLFMAQTAHTVTASEMKRRDGAGRVMVEGGRGGANLKGGGEGGEAGRT